ncbi:Putative interferon alpha-inducible protein IFI6/IFI27 [Colletotrichum destructivum]|uniref:Interferon alpha-inducible protein IFI6/IFI27 n=1 Tax=Colletotrichum destructivum TaxID=34406 RepID=A0AAX4IYT5_9PEZI|nr:Putative interferon alpha-inducible protein IFI6/IFI27 [Colletotrichum destructivum]
MQEAVNRSALPRVESQIKDGTRDADLLPLDTSCPLPHPPLLSITTTLSRLRLSLSRYRILNRQTHPKITTKMDCTRVFECFLGQLSEPQRQPAVIVEKQPGVITEQPVRSAHDAAAEFVATLRTAEKGGKDLERRLRNIVTVNSWTEELAEYILRGIEYLVQHRDTIGQVVRDAVDEAIEAAESVFQFAKDHPVFVTIIAIGILVLISPWVLEALGFSELGPVADTFAAFWQARYAGYVPKGSLFSFFQRLGMVSNQMASKYTNVAKMIKFFIVILGIAALVPSFLSLIGFGPAGPVTGSLATWWQSFYGGAVPAGGLFAYLQHIAMTWQI